MKLQYPDDIMQASYYRTTWVAMFLISGQPTVIGLVRFMMWSRAWSSSVQVMTWCRQATRHYLNRYWPLNFAWTWFGCPLSSLWISMAVYGQWSPWFMQIDTFTISTLVVFWCAPWPCPDTWNVLLQNGALWDMGLMHYGICDTGLFLRQSPDMRAMA